MYTKKINELRSTASAAIKDESRFAIQKYSGEVPRLGHDAPTNTSAVERRTLKIEAARMLVRAAIPHGTPLVDEFLRERRATWGEDG